MPLRIRSTRILQAVLSRIRMLKVKMKMITQKEMTHLKIRIPMSHIMIKPIA